MKDWKEYRLGEMIQCNPQVKLEKGKSYTLIDIDSIEIGSRYVKGKELTEYDGQSGCHFFRTVILLWPELHLVLRMEK